LVFSEIDIKVLILSFVLTLVISIIVIKILLKILKSDKFYLFGIYNLILGIIVLKNIDPLKEKDSKTALDLKDANQVVTIFLAGEKVYGKKFIECIKSDMGRIGFEMRESLEGSARYILKHKKEEEHETGEGGHAFSLAELYRGQNRVLESRKLISWCTTSDDSMDYDAGREAGLELYEEDPFGRAIFEEIQRRLSLPDHTNIY
jgi:hypothetical protein